MKTTVLFLIIATTFALAGGPWSQQKGKGYVQVSGSFIPGYSGLYSSGSDGDLSLDREISDQTFSLYAEYGLSDALTVIIEAPWKSLEAEFLPGQQRVSGQEQQAGSESGLGNLAVAVKQSFGVRNLQFAGQIRLELNSGSINALNGLNTGYDTWGVLPSISIGKGDNRYFWFADLGISFRGNDYSNDFVGGGEAGWLLFDRIWVVGALAIRAGINEGSNRTTSGVLTGLYHDNQEFVSPGLKLIWQVNERFGVNFSRFGAVSGNLVAQQASTTVGLFVKL